MYYRSADIGTYNCEVQQRCRDGSYFTVKTNHTTVLMEPLAPYFVKEPPEKILVDFGSVICIECHAEGYPKPKIQWFKDNEPLHGKHDPVLKARFFFCRVSFGFAS